MACYEVAISNLLSGSSAASTCGLSDERCTSCGTNETPREACHRACGRAGGSPSACVSTCG